MHAWKRGCIRVGVHLDKEGSIKDTQESILQIQGNTRHRQENDIKESLVIILGT